MPLPPGTPIRVKTQDTRDDPMVSTPDMTKMVADFVQRSLSKPAAAETPWKPRALLDSSPSSNRIVQWLREKGIDFEFVSSKGELVPSYQPDKETLISGEKEIKAYLQIKDEAVEKKVSTTEAPRLDKSLLQVVAQPTSPLPSFTLQVSLPTEAFVNFLKYYQTATVAEDASANQGAAQAIQDILTLLDFCETGADLLIRLRERAGQVVRRYTPNEVWLRNYHHVVNFLLES